MGDSSVYVTVLQDSLQKKLDILKKLLTLTTKQAQVLSTDDMDMDRFSDLVQKKQVLLDQLLELDQGFSALYTKLGNEIKENKYKYQIQIQQMQNLIRAIMSTGVQIEGLEQKNKIAFDKNIARQRQNIRNFKVSNKTAVSYYQNMANQHHDWQSYFVNQKK